MPTSDAATAHRATGPSGELAALLRRAGLRMTSQRATVLAALGDVGTHPTAEAIAERAHALDPGLHLATVYRTLRLLEEHQVVSHVHLGHGPAVYHLAHERHAHAVCASCGAQVEVPEAMFTSLAEELAHRLGFVLDPGHFALSGWCMHCTTGGGTGET